MSISTKALTIAAGEVLTLPIKGNHFSFFSHDVPALEVSFDDGKNYQRFTVGWSREEPFDSVKIRNIETLKTAKVLANIGWGVAKNYSADSGTISVFGNVGVVGQPSVIQGGSMSTVGKSNVDFYGNQKDAAGDLFVEAISQATNVYGVALYFYSFTITGFGSLPIIPWVRLAFYDGVNYFYRERITDAQTENSREGIIVPAGLAVGVMLRDAECFGHLNFDLLTEV